MPKIKYIVLSLFIALGVISFASASFSPSASALFESAKNQACQGTRLSNGDGGCNEAQGTKLENTIKRLLNILSVAIGVIAVVMIMINGLRFITSGGDSNSVSAAKRGIIYALVGLVVVALAQFLVRFVIGLL